METNTHIQKQLSLADLASLSDVPARTVRYYISRDLLPPPRCRGKDAYYDDEHLETLKEIKKLVFEGKTLNEIGLILKPAPVPPTKTEVWQHILLGENVTLLKREGVSNEELRTLLTMYINQELS